MEFWGATEMWTLLVNGCHYASRQVSEIRFESCCSIYYLLFAFL